MSAHHRFTLRGRIGSRAVEPSGPEPLANNLLQAVAVYVMACVFGWAAFGVVIAWMWPS